MISKETPAAAASFAGKRVLIVEDNKINLMVAQAILESLGCTIEIAENGRSGIERMAAGGFDMVLMDCQMPEMDGFEATRAWRVREGTGTARLPIVALTANALKGDRELCLAAGMDDYLAKPFTRTQLASVLSRWVSPTR